MRRIPIAVSTCLAAAVCTLTSALAQRPQAPLATRWTSSVTPDRVLPEYPRPQLVRRDWLSLNGAWNYAIRPRADDRPASYDGQILVPFPIESALSGVMKRVSADERLWYARAFEIPRAWRGRRIVLHFGAVDWEASVSVNGRLLATHRGGYDGFSVDITDVLTPAGPQEIVVSIWDPTDTAAQPRGKQVSRPSGIWYTSVTGIWQTVWIEPVPAAWIDALTIVPDVDARAVDVTATISGAAAGMTVQATALDGTREVASARRRAGEPIRLTLRNASLWSPDSPKLYDLKLTLQRGGTTVDEVTSYFGLRKSSLCKDEAGTTRLCLNNTPLFQFGPLDQGWWPDGLYTAPTDEALRYDIEITKQLGFNMARKHVKVEPDRWYYWADRLGLLVWQDMPSISPRAARTAESAAQFELELKELIDEHRNHPSIVMWVPFNEGWGQYDTARIADWVKRYDPTRLVNNASGWTDAGAGDVSDIHRYPGPGAPKKEPLRAGVLGEFGGLGLPIADHTWQSQANWSYRGFTTREALADAYVGLIDRLHPLLGGPGLAAAVYTQTTDVEIEVNGLMTYDRAMVKADASRVRAANLRLFTPPPVWRTIVETSRDAPAEWRFTISAPAADWMNTAFDDSSWAAGKGGFGVRSTPGSAVGTVWNTSDIWIRRTVDLPADVRLANPHLFLHHDEDAEVYVNGVLAAKATGFTTDYELVPLSPDARATLRPGRNTIAVHCHQTTGGQYVDVGIIDIGRRVGGSGTSEPPATAPVLLSCP